MRTEDFIQLGKYSVEGLSSDGEQKVDLTDYRINIIFGQERDIFKRTPEEYYFGRLELSYEGAHGMLTVQHELGHAVFAIMRFAFDNEWVLDNGNLDHILEEYFMQIYSDLCEEYKNKYFD